MSDSTESIPQFSEDQAAAYEAFVEIFANAGVELREGQQPNRRRRRGGTQIVAVLGKAGSGKTFFLAELVRALVGAGVKPVSDGESAAKADGSRTLAILAPTNKAASVLRNHGVPATTVHRIMYTPEYDLEYEKITQWLEGKEKTRPTTRLIGESTLKRVQTFYQVSPSVPAAFAAAGVSTADFITGWAPRNDPLDIGFVDEASMLDSRQLDDLKQVFSTIVLFGDPAQLAPVSQEKSMVFDSSELMQTFLLSRIHRQASDNPILDLAHDLLDPESDFQSFLNKLRYLAARDDRIHFSSRVNAELMARSPVLCWRNSSRIRLLDAFRRAHKAPPDALLPGEPLICDGIEISRKARNQRLDLETKGVIKGAQAVFLGRSQRRGHSRLHMMGAPDPVISVPTIIKIEFPGEAEPFMESSASTGGIFLHGAACTIHKSQGSQWPAVQIFGPDLTAASRSGMVEADLPLWKRLAYVAVTRAERQVVWVHKSSLALPKRPLDPSDLDSQMQLGMDDGGG